MGILSACLYSPTYDVTFSRKSVLSERGRKPSPTATDAGGEALAGIGKASESDGLVAGVLEGEGFLHEAAAQNGGSAEAKLITVPCSRLDDCLGSRTLPTCVVAKMDVEGFETTVLEGARDAMEKGWISVWLFELNDVALKEHGSSGENLIAAFSKHGYCICYWDEDGKRLGRRGDEHDHDRANYLACRDVRVIESRLMTGTSPHPVSCG